MGSAEKSLFRQKSFKYIFNGVGVELLQNPPSVLNFKKVIMIPLQFAIIHISLTNHHKGKQLNLITNVFTRKSISR